MKKLISIALLMFGVAGHAQSPSQPQTVSVFFTWSAVPGASSYALGYGTNSGQYLQMSQTTNNSVTISNLPAGVYYFAVRSMNANSNSLWSVETNLTVSTILYAPTNFHGLIVIPQ